MANRIAKSARSGPLTAAFASSVKEPGKYHDGKGMGLFLLVRPNGSRFWVQRLTVRGKRRELGLGSPPTVTLAEAREQALDNKRLARAGGDPLAEKRKVRHVPTFEQAARKAHVELSPTWKNQKDRDAFLSTLERYVFPRFGHVALPDVTSADVRQAILAAREIAPGVARKLIYRTSSVFRWGIAEGICTNNPATSQALALPRETRQPRHRKSLPYVEVAACIAAVHWSGAWTATKLALEFLILTASRSGEVRKARWDEVDLDTATWTVPADRAKQGRPHRVPLAPRALEILAAADTLRDGSGLVFPSRSGRALSDMTLSKLVKDLGFDADVHGFRTSFRTWGQECTDFPREVQEAALGHKMGDTAEQAYARSDLFEKRRAMMEAWSTFLSGDLATEADCRTREKSSPHSVENHASGLAGKAPSMSTPAQSESPKDDAGAAVIVDHRTPNPERAGLVRSVGDAGSIDNTSTSQITTHANAPSDSTRSLQATRDKVSVRDALVRIDLLLEKFDRRRTSVATKPIDPGSAPRRQWSRVWIANKDILGGNIARRSAVLLWKLLRERHASVAVQSEDGALIAAQLDWLSPPPNLYRSEGPAKGLYLDLSFGTLGSGKQECGLDGSVVFPRKHLEALLREIKNTCGREAETRSAVQVILCGFREGRLKTRTEARDALPHLTKAQFNNAWKRAKEKEPGLGKPGRPRKEEPARKTFPENNDRSCPPSAFYGQSAMGCSDADHRKAGASNAEQSNLAPPRC